ncbi:hypothetical protein ABT294_45470 [Nonomuraea sp. NPDC000554]|uniref:hypothetical protein n=1 Tax=Nonomuraea sp. NPDC000554 TaxID=3154259 RepID=UPI0033316041
MKRLPVVTAAAVVAALLAGSGQAQAAVPTDPITSLSKQFVPGLGVRVDETTRTTFSGIKGVFTARTNGVIGFGKSAAVNHDLTSKTRLTDEQKTALGASQDYEPTPLQAIKVGRYTYVKGFDWGTMPEGKHWIRFGKHNSSWGNDGQRGDQLVDVFDPAILKTVISKSTIAKPGEYRGTLTAHDLYKGRFTLSDVRKISFRLFVNRDQLPVRLITEYNQKTEWPNKDGKLVKGTQHDVIDTRYSDWGAKVTITAPPAGEVIGIEDVKWPSTAETPLDAVTDRMHAAVLPKD